MSARLEAIDVTVEVASGTRLLDGVSIGLYAGELHAIVGPNGAGKSTLFSVLSGDTAPTSGVVLFDGAPLSSIRSRELAQHRAVLLQQNAVAFSFTTEQVVRMGRAPWAGTPADLDDDRIVTEAMAATEVLELARRPVALLSGGERARVALARVLAQSTDVLMLDEPTAALDLKHHEDVMRLARSRADAGATIAIVLHDLNAALAHADRVTLLSDGRVVGTGAPADVLTEQSVEAVYGQPIDVFAHPRTGIPVIAAR